MEASPAPRGSHGPFPAALAGAQAARVARCPARQQGARAPGSPAEGPAARAHAALTGSVAELSRCFAAFGDAVRAGAGGSVAPWRRPSAGPCS